MTKITLESRGISVSINNSNPEEDNIEYIGFAFLGKIAEDALNKIQNKRKLNKLESDPFDNSEDEDVKMKVYGEEEDEEDEDEYDEEEDDDEYDEDEDEYDEDEYDEDEDEDEEEDEEEEEEEEDKSEEDVENVVIPKTSKFDSKNSKKKHSCTPSQCLKYIKSNNKEALVKLVKKCSKKIRIVGTNKEERHWVYKIFSDIENIKTWSLSSRNGPRILIIDSSNKN